MRVAVVPCDIGWSDIGTWNKLWELMPRDVNDNVIQGPVVVDRTSNCLLHASGRLIACTGVRDLAVIETADAVLIADRSDAAGVRRLIEILKAENRPELTNGTAGERAWRRSPAPQAGSVVAIRATATGPGRS